MLDPLGVAESTPSADGAPASDVGARNDDLRPTSDQFEQLESSFRILADMLPAIVATTRPDGTTDFCNGRFYEVTGLPWGAASRADFDWKPLIHPEDLPRVLAEWAAVVETGRPAEIRYRLRMAAGDFRWFMGQNIPLRDAQGRIVKWVVCGADIHDLQQAQQALEQSQQWLRYVLSSAPVILWGMDAAGVVTLSEGKTLAALGFKPRETLGRSVFEIYRDLPAVLDTVRRALAGETLANLQVDVGAVVLESHIEPLRDAGGTVVGATGVAIDITQLKRSEQSLRKAHDELETRVRERTAELQETVAKLRAEQDALKRLLRLHDRERQLLAYDIHDGLTQQVIGAKMIVEAAGAAGPADGRQQPGRSDDAQAQELKSDDAQARGLKNAQTQGLEVAEGLLATAVHECRRLIGNLRPLVIDEYGIVEAICYLVGQEHARGGLQLHFEHDVQFTRLAPLLEGSLFRIVQEAINNVRRHSGAHEAVIRLVQQGDQLLVEISDAGVGFEPAASVSQHRFGLEGIRKRADLFDGQLVIDSIPGRGTRLSVTLPVLAPSEDELADRAG